MQGIRRILTVFLFVLSLIGFRQQAKATHLMGMDITYECINNCTIRVHLRAYRDCAGAVGIAQQQFSWGANPGCTLPNQVTPWVPGTGQNDWIISEVTPVCPGTVTQCQNPNSPIRGVQEHYRYADFNICNLNCTSYTLEWWGLARNGAITAGAANQGLGTFVTTYNPAIVPCNSSPYFQNPPTPYICQGQPFTFNQGAIDPDGDSLSYSLGPCFTENNGVMVNYNIGYSPTQPLGPSWIVNMNPTTGDVSFIPNPGNLEVGVMCVYVQEWRNGQMINQIVRDMQINVIPCPSNNLPVVDSVVNVQNGTGQGSSNTGIQVVACINQPLCFELPVVDPNSGDTVTIWWDQSVPGGQFFQTGNPANQDTIVGVNPSVTFCWTPTTPGVTSFLVEMMDDACPNFGFSQFTVSILVSDPRVTANPEPPRCDTITICAQAIGQGIPPYTFQWNGAGGLNSTDSCVTHVYPGPGVYPYTLTMIDAAGCPFTIQDTVEILQSVTADAGPDLIACQNILDTLGGPGDPNVVYTWDPTFGLNNPNIPDPIVILNNPGPAPITVSYILTAMDTLTNCVAFDTVDVTVSFPAQLALNPTHVLCYGVNSGAVDMTISNGLLPLGISWTGPNGFTATTEDISNLGAGMYYVSVFDSAGCIVEDSVEILQPASPLWVNFMLGHVCCNDSTDGSVDMTITGGIAPYTVSWTGPNGFTSGNQDLTDLEAGTYVYTLTDSGGCVVVDSVVITEPSPVSFSFNVYDAACNGESNGVIAAHISGGHGNYSYFWPGQGATGDSISGLPAGPHTLIVRDTCYGDTVNMVFFDDFDGYSPWILNVATGPNGADRNFWAISDNEGGVAPGGCAVNNNGDATLHITNVTNPGSGANYDLGGACGISTCPETNMRAESPFINTIGQTGLVLSFDFTSVGDALLDNASLWYNDGTGWAQLQGSIKSNSCNPGTGEWSSITTALPASCENIANLQIGFQWTNNDDGLGNAPSVAINDVMITGVRLPSFSICTYIDSATVNEPTPLVVTTQGQNVLCFGDSTGQMTTNPTGGNGNYGYTWSTGATTPNIGGLPAGMYYVTVTDTAYTPAGGALGYLLCSEIDSLEVTQPTPISLATSTTPTSCFLGSDGTATVNPSGGTPGYTYAWNTTPVQTTQTATGLSTGAYTVVVTDNNGCQDSATVVVTQPSPVLVSTSMVNARCGDPNGTATVNATGGNPGYTYAWNTNPVQTTQTAIGLLPGPYVVTVTDANGCQATGTIVVGNEPNPNAQIVNKTDLLCFGDQDGTASAQATGGTAPYTFLWSNGQTGPNASQLAAGTYTVTVTDFFGCQGTDTVTIVSPPQLGGTTIVSHVGCNAQTPDGKVGVLPTGGTPGYTYVWSTTPAQFTQEAINLSPGIYFVTVTDQNGCTFVTSDTVIQIPRPDVTAGPNVSFCEGEGGAQIFATGTGGQQPYYYTWWCDSTNTFCGLDSINDNDPIANPDTSTWYYVFITDFNGCRSDTDSVFVEVLPKPIVDAGPDIYLCGDSAPCQILTPTILNASGPYTYQWIPGTGLNDSTIMNPCARPDTTTIYALVVTAGNGCSSEYNTTDTLSTVTVHVNPIPVAEAGPDRDLCLGDSLQLQGYGTGAGPDYVFEWSPADGLSDTTVANPWASPLLSTTYTLVVWSNGCPSYADSVRVEVHTIPTVVAVWDREICLGDSTLLDAQASGDTTATYSFQWYPNIAMAPSDTLEDVMVSPDTTTTYYVVATTSWGCRSAPDSSTVYVKPTPIAEAGPHLFVCEGDSVQLQGSYFYTTTPAANPTEVYYGWSPNQYMSDSTVADPWVSPPVSQWYYLEVRHNTCSTLDSTLVTVIPEVIGTIGADTSVICGGDSVQLYSTGGQGGAEFVWSPSAGLSDPTTANPMAAPDTTTTYQLIVSEGGCGDTLEYTLQVIPSPEPSYLSSLEDGCVPHTVNFVQNSTNGLNFIWDFGDGSPISNEEFPTHVYDQPGSYPVTLTVINAGGCSASVVNSTIEVFDTATVEFSSDPAFPVEMFFPNTVVHFQDESTNAVHWTWNFGDGMVSQGMNPSHHYNAPGTYMVTLVVENAEGCISRITHGPFVVSSPEIFIPNVFSPNGDGINDEFLVGYTGSQPFLLDIFDRWGVKMFSSNNKNQGWDGTNMNGDEAVDGVYYYTVRIGNRDFTGNVTLMR